MSRPYFPVVRVPPFGPLRSRVGSYMGEFRYMLLQVLAEECANNLRDELRPGARGPGAGAGDERPDAGGLGAATGDGRGRAASCDVLPRGSRSRSRSRSRSVAGGDHAAGLPSASGADSALTRVGGASGSVAPGLPFADDMVAPMAAGTMVGRHEPARALPLEARGSGVPLHGDVAEHGSSLHLPAAAPPGMSTASSMTSAGVSGDVPPSVTPDPARPVDAELNVPEGDCRDVLS